MAKEDEKKPTAAEKGKGKTPVTGDAEKDAKTGKDGKVDAEDKKGGVATATGMICLRDSCTTMTLWANTDR
jgi:26S proteasome regulatory subunit N1